MISNEMRRKLLLVIVNIFFGVISPAVFFAGVLLIVGIFDTSNPILGIVLVAGFVTLFFKVNRKIIKSSPSIKTEVLVIVVTNVVSATVTYNTGLGRIIGNLFEPLF